MYSKRRLEFHIRIRAARTDASQSDERCAWLLLTTNHRRNLPRIDSSSRKKGKYQEFEDEEAHCFAKKAARSCSESGLCVG